MRVAVYLRISTDDKGQDLDTQRLPLRDFCAAQGWADVSEYADEASAADLRRRREWQRLLLDASRRKIDLVLVWRLDRAFRSVREAANTLADLRHWGVGLRSYQEPWLDTTSPFGEALYYITVAYAGLERAMIAERVRAGMDRAKRQGRTLGRPKAQERPEVRRAWPEVRAAMEAGTLSLRAAARVLRVGAATVRRMLAEEGRAEKGVPAEARKPAS